MSLALALMVQAAAIPAPVTAPRHAAPARESFRAIDAGKAVDTFRATCWSQLRDAPAFEAAVAMLPLAFAAQPHREGPTRSWRAAEGVLSYAAELPAGRPSPQCILRVLIGGTVDQLALAARIATALQLPAGSTRVTTRDADSRWDVAQDDGRTVRLIVTSIPTAGGANIRFAALLLPPTP